MHPSDELRFTKSRKLEGKKIVLGVTGSIAAVETVKLCRELIRHGADLYPVMSESAQEIIHSNALQFASGHDPVIKINGGVQHVSLCGNVADRADLLLIAPCTANTISKIACGIDDTSVTTFATTALGSNIPIMIAPAMHSSMYNHLIIKENIKKLENIGVEFIGPIFLEKKAKIADIEKITARVIRRIGKQDFANKKVLIISGSTEESIDDVRLITNRSSGRIGIELAKSAFERGADVQLWMGRSTENIPSYISSERFGCAGDLSKMVNKMDHDIVIVPAAISDYTIKKEEGKISSKNLVLNLKKAPKIIESIRKRSNCYLVGFKAESSLSKDKLIERAYSRLKDVPMDLIVANDVKDVSIDKNHVFIIDKNKEMIEVDDTKSIIAEKILDKISKEIR